MKCAIILANGMKQIMLSPENDEERVALKMITPQDDITVEQKWGTFYGRVPASAQGYVVEECKGGYLRAYEQADALMLVIRPKAETKAVNRGEGVSE